MPGRGFVHHSSNISMGPVDEGITPTGRPRILLGMLKEFKDSKEDLPLVEGLQFGKIVIDINNEGQRKAYVLGLEGDMGLACLNFSRARSAHSGAWRSLSKLASCKPGP
jgi:hypothetical protein